MKALFAILLICLASVFASAQGLPNDARTGKVVYADAIKTTAGVMPTMAFGRAKTWLSTVDTKGGIVEDAASGLLSATGLVRVKQFDYTFRIRLQVEGSAIRYRLEDFVWHEGADQGTVEEQRDSKLGIGRALRAKILAELDAKVRASLAQLTTEASAAL